MTYRHWPARSIVDYNGGEVASTAATALRTIVVGADGAATSTILPQREPFIFRPGATALTNGAVVSGTRSSGPTVASTSANVTVWGTEVVYEPKRSGKIDGIALSGIVSGQLTIGVICSAAATCAAKLTARIRNKAGTLTTLLALTGSFNVGGTTEIFKTYDIPQLYTSASFNAVPFGVALGVQSNLAATNTVGRIMESSYIQGEFDPGT